MREDASLCENVEMEYYECEPIYLTCFKIGSYKH